MDNQRPPDSGPDDDPINNGTPERPGEGVTPDAQPTQPIAVPRGAPAPEPAEDGERLALLRRLTPTELAVLRHRCSGATTSQIASHLGISQAEARTHTGNLLDKLGVTYGREGTSLSRLSAFCPLASQLGASAGAGGLPVEPPAGQPSQRAFELTDADDGALLSQHAGGLPPSGGDGRQRWVLGGVLAFVLVAALLALLFILTDDDDGDDDDDTTADEQATEVVETVTVAAALEPTATVEVPTETPEPEPTETAVPATETPEPDEEATEEAATETAETEPTATEAAPTATTEEAEPTATDTPEPGEPTPTEQAPAPPPASGNLAYEADWSSDEDGWLLTDGWAIENGELTTTNTDAAPLLAPFEPQQADYAVEVEMIITNLNNCNERAGVFARVTEESSQSSNVLVGYAGSVCDDEWLIESVLANDRDTLERGDRRFETGSHVYRLEIAGDRIRLFIDGDFTGEATDDSWNEAGGAGIYIDGDLDLTITEFRVFTPTNSP
jgi:DNA-binding CsgD family transcriptional regulator